MYNPRSLAFAPGLIASSMLLLTAFGCPKSDPPVQGEGPAVVETDPADGATDVVTSATIQVVFDGAVNASTLTAATFYLDPDAPGAVGWDEATLTATLTPTEHLAANTTYTVRLTTGIKGANGGALRQAHSFQFVTGDSTEGPGTRTTTHTFGADTVTVTVRDPGTQTRTYTLQTTAELRDNDPSEKRVTFTEQEGQMILRSGNDLFDALFAMSIEETRQLSVDSISDWGFNHGQGVDCDCFETGAKWNYVWTRDTAYAVDLGLAFSDPTRSKNSLDFKLSERKAGGDLQIVQDTGTGGSYPVSTDRVVWAIGAWEVLKFLHGSERDAFRDKTLEAMKNTIEQDREMVFDAKDGLYHGEQSFLDWREQSYPMWTAFETVHIAMSKTLSTNVGHYALLRFAGELAGEVGDTALQTRYAAWAGELATALHRELWLAEQGTYSAMKTTTLDPAALHKYDLLGLSLAVLQELPSAGDAASIVSHYPHSTMGPPVLWPQQPMIPIYHNRGIWPFVTAYALLAARQTGNAAVFDHDLESLVRGAAVNISNMENFEFMTLGNWVDDGDFSGPVVNSRRQLWSVAGYMGAIVKGVFGLEATQQDIHFAPFVTGALRNGYLAESDAILLRNLAYRGKLIDVELRLPAEAGSGALKVASVTLNGNPHTGSVTAGDLGEDNLFVITLEDAGAPAGTINIVEDTGDFRRFWAPR
ncbi:MAG: Ig-like domain-containing protein, partial [Bradymonadaceae bacterium]